jgi:hypothetical protein
MKDNIFPLIRQTYTPRIMKRKLKVMVSNSTNINKTNNHLSPQTIEHKKKTMTYGIGNPVLVWDRHLGQALKCARLNRFNLAHFSACPIPGLDFQCHMSWSFFCVQLFEARSPATQKTPAQIPCHSKNTCTDSLPLKKHHTLSQNTMY